VVIPLVIKICATSNGEQKVQVLIPVVLGLSHKQQQLMRQYFDLVDWQGLKLPSAERRQRDSLVSFERSVEVCTDWIHLKMMMMIALITTNSALVPLIEGLCAQILYLRFEIIGDLRSNLLLFFFGRKNMLKKKAVSPRSHPAS